MTPRQRTTRPRRNGIETGLGLLGLKRADLARTPRGQIQKQVLAWWIYGRKSVARRWVAENLQMGYETRASQAMREVESSRAPQVMNIKKQLVECGF